MTETLYAQLGGYDAIAAVADNLLGRLKNDPQLARFLAASRRRWHSPREAATHRLLMCLCRRPAGLCRPQHEDGS